MARKSKDETDKEFNVVKATGARVCPPDNLTPAQLSIWKEIVDSLPADYFRPSDIPLLAAFCKAQHYYNLACEELDRNGITLINDRGNRCANPAHQVLVSQASAMAQLSVKLRLAPSSRYDAGQAGTKTKRGTTAARPWETADGTEG